MPYRKKLDMDVIIKMGHAEVEKACLEWLEKNHPEIAHSIISSQLIEGPQDYCNTDQILRNVKFVVNIKI